MEDGVEIALAQLDFILRAADLGLGHEQEFERLVDMGRHRLAGRDAA